MEHVVLLVDDDKNVLHGLTRALRRQPYQLYTAQSGDEATWILKAHDVDVLVTDEKMPGMSGCDLVNWVAEHYPEIVRIVLTGYATTETAIRAINEGAVYQFFTKPCRDLHLAMAIRRALEHREKLKDTFRRRAADQPETVVSDSSRVGGDSSRRSRQTLAALAQTVSCDLRRPLQRLSESCRANAQRNAEALDPEAQALLDGALEAAAKAGRLVDELREGSPREPLDQNGASPDGRGAGCAGAS